MASTASPPAANGSSAKSSEYSEPSAPPTYFHSFFSNLLSWDNPRSSAIAYASIVTFIVAGRYLDVVRWAFKLTWIVLGVAVAAEVAGKAVLNKGLASQLRPRQYYTIPRETFEALLGDMHDLLNFFVIEAQRIAFAENVYATAAAFVGALIAYILIKFVPYWGLALIFNTVVFFAPLVYKTNKELIDEQLKQASNVINTQTSQLRETAHKHTAHAADLTKQYLGDYTTKAQQLLRGRHATSAATTPIAPSFPTAPSTAPSQKVSEADFPTAPKAAIPIQKPVADEDSEEESSEEEEEPLISA
ncbi:cell lysis protein [Grosmannia clavigera kw1407]|uniref:Reticulon-like protein n=1 Tax=Grosmannia clavigera (strain kw1407 / UAMH 11150) TaxID=655863 RepID=F0XAF8_GROCL|nr:cell lysis protein [Grosmannia clavigera kw1407]EFX05896.1 cell lysis protein [Grosmannia clavigera kw1407]